MHPEVTQTSPGNCSKCGMRLVSSDDQGSEETTWKNYIPLIVIILLILVVSAVVSWNDFRAGNFSIFQSISYFMIGFFIVFSGFKLMDLKGFAEGYSTYDLLAQKIFGYGYVYPFIELSFGLLMLLGIETRSLLWTEVIVMGFSGLGVVNKLMRRETIKCVCLGTVLKVPLTTVTLVEDFGMALLALILLLQ